MSTTTNGVVFPEPGDHTRLWEHFEALADSINDRFNFRAPEIFTESGTWNDPGDGFKAIKVTCVGSGGGGGGSSNVSAQTNAGGGGGAAMAIKWIAASALGATENVTVPSGGSGGSTGGSNGSNGAASSFGSHCSANGGSGGQGVTGTGSVHPGGSGGAAGTGDIVTAGSRGELGYTPTVAGASNHLGAGGGSPMSGEARLGHTASDSGTPGRFPGGGGSGGCRHSSGAVAVSGGAGADGVVIVEYIY